MAAITLTKHAVDRMRQRGVSRHDVVRALAFGRPEPTDLPAVYLTRVRESRFATKTQPGNGRSIVVIYERVDEGDEHRILTVYRS